MPHLLTFLLLMLLPLAGFSQRHTVRGYRILGSYHLTVTELDTSLFR